MSNEENKENNNGPQIVNPVDEETLEAMKRGIPKRQGIELDETPANMFSITGPMIGIGNKDFVKSNWGNGNIYSVLERTDLQPGEPALFGKLIARAEHGLGGSMDRPHSKIGERVVTELMARRSLYRGSSQEFVEILTTWFARLKAQEDEKLKDQKKMVGS